MPTIDETKVKLSGFADLETGWHFGEGVSPKSDIIASALTILEKLSSVGIERVNAFPGIAGEVRVTAYLADDYYEFTVEKNGTVSHVYERSDVEMESSEGLSLPMTLKLIDHRCKVTQPNYVLHDTSTPKNIGNKVPAILATIATATSKGGRTKKPKKLSSKSLQSK